MSAPSVEAETPRRSAIVLVAVLGLAYAFSQFLRNSTGVIGPNLMADINIGPEVLGLLTGAFFFSFAMVQIPVGVAIDRYGARRTMGVTLVLAVAGTVLFAVASSSTGLIAGRMLMGVGCSTLLMAPLAIYTRWFTAERFSTMVAIQFGIGNLGTLAATAPLAAATASFGWRNSFLVVAVLVTAVAVIAYLIARDAPPGRPAEPAGPESLGAALKGVVTVIRTADAWPVFAIHFFSYSCFVTVLGLWGGPYLTDVHGLDLEERGSILLIVAVAQVASLFVWGPLDRLFNRRKAIVLVGVGGQIACLTALVMMPQIGLLAVTVILALFGMVSAYVPVMTAHGRALYDQALVGRGLTFMNVGAIGGVFVVQAVSGFLITLVVPDAAPGAPLPAIAYQAVFGFLAAALVFAGLVYSRAADRPPR